MYRYVAGLPSANSEASLSEQGGNPESPRGPASPPPGLDARFAAAVGGLTPSGSAASLHKMNMSSGSLAGHAGTMNGKRSESSTVLHGAENQGLLPKER